MRLYLTLISLLCFHLCVAASGGFQGRRYSAADGLPNHTVRDIMQDSHGFVWIGTLNGLSRFDGRMFTTFRSEPANPLSLSDNRVISITEDHDQYLWIETTGRIFSCFDLRKGRFVSYTEKEPSTYNRLFTASNGDVWLSNTDGGVLQVSHLPDRRLKPDIYDAASSRLPADGVNVVYETQDGDILLGTSAGFSRVSGGNVRLSSDKADVFSFFESKGITYAVGTSGKVFRIRNMDLIPVATLPTRENVSGVILEDDAIAILTDKASWQADLKSGRVIPHPALDIKGGQVLIDNKGRRWIYNHTGHLTFLSQKDRSYKTLNLIPPDIMSRTDHERYRIVEDPQGTIWISTYGNGLFAYREEDGSLQHFISREDALLGSNSLRGMMIDATGTIWLGTGQNGISTIWPDTREIHRFLPDPHSPADRNNSIRALYPGHEGAIIFSSKDGKLHEWLPGDSSASTIGKYKANLYSLLADGNGDPLYGTRGDGLYVGDRHYRHIQGDASSLPNDNIYFIRRDRKGRVWIGTFGGGLALMTPDAEKGAIFQTFFREMHGRAEQRYMIEDLDGRFWIGTSEGLLTFHPDSLLEKSATAGLASVENAISEREFKVYSKSNSDLNCNEVRYLMRDSKGDLWIATGNNGVIRAVTSSDGSLEVRKQFTTADGLANNSVQSIVEDDEGLIWIATEYGLSRLHPQAETFDTFTFSDEPSGNTYAEGSVLKLKNGILLFGTSHGILSIDPKKVSPKEGIQSPLRFTGLTINGTTYGPGSQDSPLLENLDYTDRIELKPHQNSFAVDFAVMDYRDSDRFRYSYMLEGHDMEWSAHSPEAKASFSYLPSGSYTLKVRCLDGGRILAEGQLEIAVKAPWWRTPWAIAGYLLVAAAIVWLILRRKSGLRRKIGTHASDENVGTHGSCVRVQSDTESDTNPSAADARAVRPYREDTPHSPAEDPFLEKIENVAKANIANAQFSVDDFASAMNLGRAVFYRKLKETADTTPNEYLKKLRMKEAARLLRTAPELNIAEISDRVGFSDSLYFSKCFKAEFGQSPTNYRKSSL